LPSGGRLEVDDLIIDLDFEGVRQAGSLVRLTETERTILAVLVANQDRTVTREALLLELSGDRPRVDIRSRVIDVHLNHIRAKLGDPPYLRTVDGIGYRVSSKAIDADDSVRRRRRDQRRAWARGTAQSAPSPPVTQPGTERRTGR